MLKRINFKKEICVKSMLPFISFTRKQQFAAGTMYHSSMLGLYYSI